MTAELQSRLLTWIKEGSSTAFEKTALEVFAFQYERNSVYRAYCDRQGLTLKTVRAWQQVPAVPTSAFRDFGITCFPVTEAAAEFHTSGTTKDKPGKHYFPTTALCDAAILPNFAAHLLPDGARLPMFVLTASPDEAPHSSLSHMMGVVMREFGDPDSRFYVTEGKLRIEALVNDLRKTEVEKRPVFLLGTAFAFVHLFDLCGEQKLKLELAAGSRAMETGGFKGRSREMSKRELYALFERVLGIPPTHVVNEYGMTELSSQFYDETMRVGRQSDLKLPPPWTRVLVIDPNTGLEAAPGNRGLLRIFDLANLWSAMCIQTEDIGIAREDGFEIIGRAAGAEVRGCSLTAETLKLV